MPSWRVHRAVGRRFGFEEELMEDVDRMLDFPEAFGVRLGHRTVHNWVGVLEAYIRHGSRGAEYAILHIMLDSYLKPAKLLDKAVKICSNERSRGVRAA
jgi:hypothetical protein